ncbi:hypothetical protein REPUB_Repub13aG0072400 [Reevesia pubescens]
MAALQNSVPSLHHTLFLNFFPQRGLQKHHYGAFPCCKRGVSVHARAEQSSSAAASSSSSQFQETKKGFLLVTDNKDGYSFLYPFGWQEVVIEGQDKVFKDVIEPLESVSVNMIPTSKQDIQDFGPPEELAEILIKKVLAPPNQKTKLIGATEHDVDGKAYYIFEFVSQAPNYTRHALTAVSIGNGKFYTLTTGANERRWDKMKDRLFTVVDSFNIFNV